MHRCPRQLEIKGAWQLRCASKLNWPRFFCRIDQLILSAGIIGCFAGKASAQTQPLAQPFAAPLIGQVSIKSPLSTTAVENRPRFAIVPSLRTVYDSNPLRFAANDTEPRDNIRVTPGIDLDYKRLFGRVSLTVSGSAGYDYNSRYNFLNRSRLNFNGAARAPVGAICSLDTSASYERATFDLNDIQTADTEEQLGAISTTQSYTINAGCKREAGFAPFAGFNYQQLDNSRARFFNTRRSAGTVGLSYSQPSIGTLSLNATYTRIHRTFIANLTGINDDTSLYGFALGLNRSVSPRFRINVAGGLTKAVPNRDGVRSFSGATYSGRLEWVPTSRILITGAAGRQVTSQNGISSTYVIRNDYTLTAGFKASDKSQITLAGSRAKRDFRGEDLTPFLQPLRNDKVDSLSANYTYNLTRRVRIGLGISHRWRKADNPVYDYQSTVLSSSIGANF